MFYLCCLLVEALSMNQLKNQSIIKAINLSDLDIFGL